MSFKIFIKEYRTKAVINVKMGKRHSKDMHDHSNGKVKIAVVCELDDKKYHEGVEWLGYSPKHKFSERTIGSYLEAVLRMILPHQLKSRSGQ